MSSPGRNHQHERGRSSGSEQPGSPSQPSSAARQPQQPQSMAEYYGDLVNNKYYYNYYHGASLEQQEDDQDEDEDEPEDGHELLARLAPPTVGGEEGEDYDDDNNQTDSDSDELDEEGEYRASVTSSVRAHVYEGGMRFHAYEGTGSNALADGETAGDGTTTRPTTHRGRLYVLPNDETEQNRDDMKHAVSLLVMRGQPFYAPVHERLVEGGDVYDLGTGTGIWAIELADKYPRSIVNGVDLSPIQPNYVPSNVFFAVDDFEDDWASPPDAFDFVHMRHSLFAVEDRPALLRRIFRHLRPGGFVEFQELLTAAQSDDGSLTETTPYALRDFFRFVAAGMQRSPRLAGGDLMGTPWSAAASAAFSDRLCAQLRAAGFVNVHAAVHKCPLGTWPRDRRLRGCGLLMRTALMDGLRSWACRPLGSSAGGLGWTNTQIEVFLVDVRKAVMDPNIHAYFPLHVVYAQKPELAADGMDSTATGPQ
ncbi:tam domain protein [Grosmannia clavigera kw1407]|uniref:Tam domain protein n=1 Tax=Grosmannia clavigera (strain kw1407 / UAMH 11150) TaxID=655863 RepID=F0XQH2_GROCL|nr:tam domain protein [Grosmannia clavigera kw1407]EFX00233.1 tam domain protein [Grosmannia clavigera kw1407]